MKLTLPNPTQNSYNLLRRAGYSVFNDPNTGKTSYTRRLGNAHYPRFHIYVNKEGGGELELTLHLDQKRASYQGQTSHSGEYDTDVIKQEATRIQQLARQTTQQPEEKQKKGFFAKLFGK